MTVKIVVPTFGKRGVKISEGGTLLVTDRRPAGSRSRTSSRKPARIIVATRGRASQEDFTYTAHEPGTWHLPLTVIIDQDSASAAEIFAGAIRDHHRGTIVGVRSFGKGSVQGIFPLDDSTAVPPSPGPAPAEAPSVTARIDEPDSADPPPRVIRPSPAARVAKADPFGLRIAGRLAESIRETYGDSLRGFYLYGMRALGPAPAETDVETVVVLAKVDHYGAELERTSHICSALSHEMNLVVSRIFVSEADWNGGPDGVMPAVRAEAVAV